MSGWNDGGRSDKGSEEKKTKCVKGIYNCKRGTVEPIDERFKASPVEPARPRGPDLRDDPHKLVTSNVKAMFNYPVHTFFFF